MAGFDQRNYPLNHLHLYLSFFTRSRNTIFAYQRLWLHFPHSFKFLISFKSGDFLFFGNHRNSWLCEIRLRLKLLSCTEECRFGCSLKLQWSGGNDIGIAAFVAHPNAAPSWTLGQPKSEFKMSIRHLFSNKDECNNRHKEVKLLSGSVWFITGRPQSCCLTLHRQAATA